MPDALQFQDLAKSAKGKSLESGSQTFDFNLALLYLMSKPVLYPDGIQAMSQR